jgi:hypothetical protein
MVHACTKNMVEETAPANRLHPSAPTHNQVTGPCGNNDPTVSHVGQNAKSTLTLHQMQTDAYR